VQSLSWPKSLTRLALPDALHLDSYENAFRQHDKGKSNDKYCRTVYPGNIPLQSYKVGKQLSIFVVIYRSTVELPYISTDTLETTMSTIPTISEQGNFVGERSFLLGH
jgi:hypothetical protein